MKFLIEILALSLTVLLVGGCGSSSDVSSESIVSSTSVSGQFVDDPVSGLNYKCSSGTVGVTDSSGGLEVP